MLKNFISFHTIVSVEVNISIYCLDDEIDRKIDLTAIQFLLVQNRQQTHDWTLTGYRCVHGTLTFGCRRHFQWSFNKMWNARFTILPFKPLSRQKRRISPCFLLSLKIDYFQLRFTEKALEKQSNKFTYYSVLFRINLLN